jgi:hypothetical protein
MTPTTTEPTPPGRLIPLLAQFDFARQRLTDRMAGPEGDSGNGVTIAIPELTDEEYLWEPVPNCWSIRPRATGPGPRATALVGAGEWGRDSARPSEPYPPPFTTIAWRLGHLSEMLALRAEYTIGGHAVTRDDYRFSGKAGEGLISFAAGADAWRAALLSTDDAALGTVGYSTYPYGSDAEDPFIDIVWWVNQELLHHGAEIALLRDLYRERRGSLAE